jgi:hypothetical protein
VFSADCVLIDPWLKGESINDVCSKWCDEIVQEVVGTGLPRVRAMCSVVVYIYMRDWGVDRNDHTTMTAPLPVCSAKLSIVGPG